LDEVLGLSASLLLSDQLLHLSLRVLEERVLPRVRRLDVVLGLVDLLCVVDGRSNRLLSFISTLCQGPRRCVERCQLSLLLPSLSVRVATGGEQPLRIMEIEDRERPSGLGLLEEVAGACLDRAPDLGNARFIDCDLCFGVDHFLLRLVQPELRGVVLLREGADALPVRVDGVLDR
jgi:hypothetical protein